MIEASWLRKHGYFSGFKSGQISWSNGLAEEKSRIQIEVSTDKEDCEESYVRLKYKVRKWQDENWQLLNLTNDYKSVGCNVEVIFQPLHKMNLGSIRNQTAEICSKENRCDQSNSGRSIFILLLAELPMLHL